MNRFGRSVVAILALAVVAGCGGDDEIVDPITAQDHTFVFEPHANNPDISSIVVRGSMNEWAGDDIALTLQANGNWSVTTELEPGEYQYKYVFNGDQWASNMCDDATWGNPDNDGKIDPNVVTCVDDGFGGQNATLVID